MQRLLFYRSLSVELGSDAHVLKEIDGIGDIHANHVGNNVVGQSGFMNADLAVLTERKAFETKKTLENTVFSRVFGYWWSVLDSNQ